MGRWGDYDHDDGAYQGSFSYDPERYRLIKPFDDLDRKKWPNTFMQLMLFFYGGEWYSMTTYVKDNPAIPDIKSPRADVLARWKTHLAKEPKSEDYTDWEDWLAAYEKWDNFDYEMGGES